MTLPLNKTGILAVTLLGFLLFSACGYQMVGKETHVPPGLSSIAIPTFKNSTFEPGIEIFFTQVFLNEFIQDRRVKVVSREEADCILEGVVRYFQMSSVAYGSTGFVSQYSISVTADFTLKDRTGKVLWTEKGVGENQWFQVPSGSTSGTIGIATETAKQVGIQKAAGSMAERIRNRFFYNF